MLLVKKGDTVADYRKVQPDAFLHFSIGDKPSGRSFTYQRRELLLYPLLAEHMYIFEAEANNVESSELFFEFQFYSEQWKIGECGIRPCKTGIFVYQSLENII